MVVYQEKVFYFYLEIFFNLYNNVPERI